MRTTQWSQCVNITHLGKALGKKIAEHFPWISATYRRYLALLKLEVSVVKEANK